MAPPIWCFAEPKVRRQPTTVNCAPTPIHWWCVQPFRPPSLGMVLESRTRIGQRGEAHVVRQLIAQGHLVLARNWVWNHSELDVLTQQGESLVVHEVKSRSGCDAATPMDIWFPSKQQQRRLLRAGHAFARLHAPRLHLVRFDVHLVNMDRPSEPRTVMHIAGALDGAQIPPSGNSVRVGWRRFG